MSDSDRATLIVAWLYRGRWPQGDNWSGRPVARRRVARVPARARRAVDLYAMELGDALGGGKPKEPVKLTRGEGIDGASRPSWSR